MNQITIKKALLYILTPTAVLSLSYLILGHFCQIPHLLLFCLLGTVTLVPIELGSILFASKKEFGSYSLKSALSGQGKVSVWKTLLHKHMLSLLLRSVFSNRICAGIDTVDQQLIRSIMMGAKA